ncbi:uncharacterized protein BX664DRAFT_337167, partial [Halteromyces radiatus]|uniref:uncharacterized protein n=1 Tax=Halteromyces radiatus TaxID=101107 RepID=UPI00221F6BCA
MSASTDTIPVKKETISYKPNSNHSSPTCRVQATRFIYKDSEFEYSIHSPGTRFGRELAVVFPSLTNKQLKEILVVPVIQRCEHDMVGITQTVNHERNEKLEIFVSWGKSVVDRLRRIGIWADIMDPASGFPIYSEAGPTPYPDVQGTQTLTKYDIQNVGCCHILLHPTWNSSIYPSTLFTTAPYDLLVKVINEIV